MSEPQDPSTGAPEQAMPTAPPLASPPGPPTAAPAGWGQPQPAQTGWVMPASVAQGPGGASGLVIVAALFLLGIGVLTVIAGAALFLTGNLVGQFGTGGASSGVFGVLGGFVAGVAVVVIAWALLEIFGAFGMLLRRGWGRAIGIVVGVMGAVFTGFGLVAALGTLGNADIGGGDSGFTGGGVAVVLVVFVGYLLTVFALLRGGGHFRRA